jgi:hypothetical protein
MFKLVFVRLCGPLKGLFLGSRAFDAHCFECEWQLYCIEDPKQKEKWSLGSTTTIDLFLDLVILSTSAELSAPPRDRVAINFSIHLK